jgi:hypothetical protein
MNVYLLETTNNNKRVSIVSAIDEHSARDITAAFNHESFWLDPNCVRCVMLVPLRYPQIMFFL